MAAWSSATLAVTDQNSGVGSERATGASSDSGEIRLDLAAFIPTLLVICVVIEVTLVAADYWINYRELTDIGALQRLFNITREDSLASFFGIIQAVFVALTLWVIWSLVRRSTGSATAGGLSTRRRAAGWLVLALFFTYMALDDGAMIHERLGTAFEEIAEDASPNGNSLLGAFPSYAWQVLFVPLFGALGLFTLLFLWRELGPGRARWIMVAALACLPVAVGLDFIEGLEDDHSLNVYAFAAEHYELDDYTQEVFYASGLQTLRHFSRSLEETLEMFATTLLWVVFLGYLGLRFRGVRISA